MKIEKKKLESSLNVSLCFLDGSSFWQSSVHVIVNNRNQFYYGVLYSLNSLYLIYAIGSMTYTVPPLQIQ